MPMRFQERNGKTTVFVDPTDPRSRLTHTFSSSKKNVGKDRVPSVSVSVTQSHFHKYDPCENGLCLTASTDERGSINLNGVSPDEIKLVWEALKFNMDIFVNNQGSLSALAPELTLTTLRSAESFRPITP